MKQYYLYLKFIILLLLMVPRASTYAQIVINEYSASNIAIIADNHSKYEDWIELYNSGSSPVNLQGYHLSDDYSKPDKWTFPSVSINSNGFLIIFCSGRNEAVPGYTHTNFKLTQTDGDKIIFTDASLAILDSTWLRLTQKNNSWGRTTNGAATWSLFTTPTPGASNTNPQIGYVPQPQFSVSPGFYASAITVNITCTDPGADIHYTLDGSTPTPASATYTVSVNIADTKVLRARAFHSSVTGLQQSFVQSSTYFINVSHSVAVVSVFGDDIETLLGGNQINPETGFEYFDKTHQFKAFSYGTSNKHGNDSWAYGQRAIDFVSRDQYGYNFAIKNKLFSGKKRDEFQRIILKDAANDNYPFAPPSTNSPGGGAHIRDAYVATLSQLGHLSLDERTYEPCILYADGKYWGVYEIREKVDDADFCKYYYNQSEYNIQMLQTWGGTWSAYGGAQAQTDWDNLKNFILSNNMAVQSNYDYVDSLLNVKSLVDYFTLNSFVVCKDWLNWNTEWWRGLDPAGDKKKWRYCLWDEDATFGFYINYTGIPNIGPDADPCDPNTLGNPGGQGHVPILNALMDNPGFKEFYINRYVDLINTTFNCQFMQHALDSIIAIIDPEMPLHCTRWGGTYNTWVSNVQAIKQFIDDRCIDLTNGMISCYNLKGPYDLNIDVSPAGSGTVQLNSINIPTYSWTGKYFGNINLHLNAHIKPGHVFDHWTIDNDTLLASTLDSVVTLTLDTNARVVAHFKTTATDSLLPPPVTEPGGDILVPTAFSPDGDGNNDEYRIFGRDIASIDLHIFNRWGQEVFSTTNKDSGWDGTFKGEKLNTGVFAYSLKIVLNNNQTLSKKGTITLMR